MFEDLKSHITKENLHKLKVQNSRYNRNSEQNEADQISREEDILDELDRVQILEKQETFEQIMKRHEGKSNSNNQQQNDDYSNKKAKVKHPQLFLFKNSYSKTQPKINYSREYHLAIQQNNILKNNHIIQIKFQKESHQRQLQLLQLEIDKLKFINIQLQKQDSKVKLLSKQLQNYRELYDACQIRISQLEQKYSNAKLENVNLMQRISKFEKQQIFKRVQNNQLLNSPHENQNLFLKERIQNLEKQILQKDYKIKNYDQKYRRACKEIETLNLQVLGLKDQHKKTYEKLQQTCYEKLKKLESLNTQLSRKNTSLEQSLLEHLSQASRMIYNNNTNMTNITEPAVPNKGSHKGSPKMHRAGNVQNIQDQSSIAVFQSERKTRKSFMQKNSANDIKAETNRRQSMNQKAIKDQPQKTEEDQVNKLKSKLNLANRKIVQLLEWKCKVNSANIKKR